jgi:hypothetical protein
MASFTDLIVSRIRFRQQEFLAGLSSEPVDDVEEQLASGVRSLWHALDNVPATNESQSLATGPAAAVDGSRAVRALNSGADWIVAQALLLGPYRPLTVADTLLVRGETERPVVDRCGAVLMLVPRCSGASSWARNLRAFDQMGQQVKRQPVCLTARLTPIRSCNPLARA